MIATTNEQTTRLLDALRADIGPVVSEALEDAACEDVILNSNGQLWDKRSGHGWRHIGDMTQITAEALITTVARLRGIDANHESPIVQTILPHSGDRFEAFLPPVVVAPSFAIRRRAQTIWDLSDYVEREIMTPEQSRRILEAIHDRQTILISGATGSGKTTLANACLAAFPEHERVIIVEDTPELQCNSPLAETMLATATVTLEQCLKAALRARPDRIVVGEVRGPEALSMLKAYNTGHPGGLCTIHANDPASALVQLGARVREAIPQLDATDMIREAIRVIVHIDGPRLNRPRMVSAVVPL